MRLPPWPARRFLQSEPGVSYYAHPMHHAEADSGTAPVCQAGDLWRQPPPLALLPFPPPHAPPPRGPCVFPGQQTAFRDCPSLYDLLIERR
jgi:hypothetical protein